MVFGILCLVFGVLLDGLAALNVVCLDVVEVNPDLDDHQCATAKLAATVAMEILGEVAAPPDNSLHFSCLGERTTREAEV